MGCTGDMQSPASPALRVHPGCAGCVTVTGPIAQRGRAWATGCTSTSGGPQHAGDAGPHEGRGRSPPHSASLRVLDTVCSGPLDEVRACSPVHSPFCNGAFTPHPLTQGSARHSLVV